MIGIDAWGWMMPHTVLIEPWLGVDAYNKPMYGAATSYKAQVQSAFNRSIRTVTGEEKVASVKVTIAAAVMINPQDKITLPTGWVPQQPPILSAQAVSDENGLHHTVVY